MQRLMVLACLVLGISLSAAAQPADMLDVPIGEVKSLRASSADPHWQHGNGDARPIPAGETITLAELEGPGRITHIWFTIASWTRWYPREVVIRMYWDDSDTPSVEAPLGDFFAAGHGMMANVDSAMATISSHGRAYNCYWPMPFRKSARITATNDGATPVAALFWYIDWEQREIAADTPYFHAQYRQEHPVSPGSDYLIFDGKGAGRYVGTVLSVRMSQPGWFGEGDDRFYIDGDEEPTLRGTGTEDYFSDAWAFRQFCLPYNGVPVWEGQFPGDRGVMYRWHVHDPIYFGESMKFTIEHKGTTFDKKTGAFVDGYTDTRPDWYSSVAFWYQTGPAKRFAEMPPVETRLPAFITYEAEDFVGKADLPEGVGTHDYEYYSGGKALFDTNAHAGRGFTIPFEVEEPGRYTLFVRPWMRGDSGIFTFYVNGTRVRSNVDTYASNGTLEDFKLGHDHHFEAGPQELRIECVGGNDEAGYTEGRAYKLFLDAIYMERIGDLFMTPEEAAAGQKEDGGDTAE